MGFVDIGDAYCTGSSIMPQKKNPDVPELVRGKTGRVYGHLMALLTLMKAQPLAYNRDNQEDKEPLFDTLDTLHRCLDVYAAMMPHIKVRREVMKKAASAGYTTATDLADYLVRKGVPPSRACASACSSRRLETLNSNGVRGTNAKGRSGSAGGVAAEARRLRRGARLGSVPHAQEPGDGPDRGGGGAGRALPVADARAEPSAAGGEAGGRRPGTGGRADLPRAPRRQAGRGLDESGRE